MAISHLETETSAAAGLGLLLQLVRDLLVGLEELCGAPVEADGLALGQLALAVRLVDALEGADLDHAGKGQTSQNTAIFQKEKKEISATCNGFGRRGEF